MLANILCDIVVTIVCFFIMQFVLNVHTFFIFQDFNFNNFIIDIRMSFINWNRVLIAQLSSFFFRFHQFEVNIVRNLKMRSTITEIMKHDCMNLAKTHEISMSLKNKWNLHRLHPNFWMKKQNKSKIIWIQIYPRFRKYQMAASKSSIIMQILCDFFDVDSIEASYNSIK